MTVMQSDSMMAGSRGRPGPQNYGALCREDTSGWGPEWTHKGQSSGVYCADLSRFEERIYSMETRREALAVAASEVMTQ